MVGPTLAEAMARGPVVLDGGLATQLEAAGHDLSGELWSARLLAQAPDAIRGAHLAYLRAGAQVITTASYQATLPGFARRGYDGPALLRRSVTLAREAIERYRQREATSPLWIAASVGPYGAMLADGSEYRGDYGLSVAELVAFHRPRLEILADAGPDVLALETVPDVREAEAMLIALDGLGVPAWLSYTVDRGRTRAGQSLAEAFGLVAGVDAVIAVGANCSAPAEVTAAVPAATHHASKPAVAYPNSGETWNPAARTWTDSESWSGPGVPAPGTDQDPSGERAVGRWVADGARLVGGCCRVTPEQIAAVRAAVHATGTGPHVPPRSQRA
jgi:homocysteine S-methyltransferase